MANSSFLVVRIHPDSPVDAATFGTYLDGLQIQAYSADQPPTLLGQTAKAGPPVTIAQVPFQLNTYVVSVLKLVTTTTAEVSSGDFGTELVFEDAAGIAVGSVVTASDSSLFSGNTTVTKISAPTSPATTQKVTLNQKIPKLVPAGTIVTFYFVYGPSGPGSISINPDWGAANPSFDFTLKTSAKANNSTDVSFANTDGVLIGMQVSAAGVAAGTEVTAVTDTSVTLSKAVTLAKNASVTFTQNLNSGIVQHIEPLAIDTIIGNIYFPIPASIATAIIPLSSPPPANDYLDVEIVATRNSETIPVEKILYNVIVTSQGSLPTPDQYQGIPLAQTSLYLTLPPPPLHSSAINLILPNDGTAPLFDGPNGLLAAMKKALENDPDFPPSTDISTLSVDQCVRVAYDIVWSRQNVLPAPPDPLESLYTNPPNPGGSNGKDSSGNSDTNNLEQDRQKFEGTINSFYSIRNAEAERLTKFVAAASAAVFCEQTSLNSASALLEFPVDPSSDFATAVESELLIRGLGVSGKSGIHFGVPAGFFYALSSSLDKSTTAAQRFQQAAGDAIERLMQLFSTAINAGSITDSEPFVKTGMVPPSITSFQAARRLLALRISAASTTPSATVAAGTPLAGIIKDWLAMVDPTPVPPPNPPLTYQNTDFNLWTQKLAASDPQGYLYLDLDALTQGYVIPAFKANPLVATSSGSTLTFAALNADGDGIGIGPGMPVSGVGIAPGTTVKKTETITTVTLSAPGLSGPVTTTTNIIFSSANSQITAQPNVNIASGTTLTFAGTPVTAGIGKGMSVRGTSIPDGTTVTASVTTVIVTLSLPVLAGGVSTSTAVQFNGDPATAGTLADQIAAWLPSTTSPPTIPPTVETLKQTTALEWTTLFTFTGNQSWLPPFTQPVAPGASPVPGTPKAGYTALRIRAFIRAVHQFFTVSSAPTTAQLPEPDAPPVFDLPAPSNDLIALAVANLPAGFVFGKGPLTAAQIDAAVQGVFEISTDAKAQAWLAQVIATINELCQIAAVVPDPAITPNPVSLRFAVAEALFARGFRSAKDITRLSAEDFQQALTGTVAWDFANSGSPSLYQQAQTIAPSSPSSGETGGSFQPINPDGSLVNCVPPPCLSPTGPIVYLQEMLTLSPSSTCKDPGAPPADGQMTLGDALKTRRGPLGDLMASCANLETPLPSIDIVNECLEYLASAPDTAGGTVYDTSADQLAGHELCREKDCSEKEDCDCHVPKTIFAALPEYSTPATPVKGKNDSVEPLAWNNLKVDFSTCHLPYSQALDVSRTYLKHFGSCRFEELRTFRRCITEFALQPENPPTGFQSYLWRYPVRIDTAIEYLGITPEEYATLFQGVSPQPCADSQGGPAGDGGPNTPPGGQGNTPGGNTAPGNIPPPEGIRQIAVSDSLAVWQLYGFASPGDNDPWTKTVVILSEFLERTCLTYCEFFELWQSGFVAFRNNEDRENGAFPQCEPCCLDQFRLGFGEADNENRSPEQDLLKLAIFIRLWRKLKHSCCFCYSFAQLRDICDVLHLFNGATINPGFIRQLAAFQILRDHFDLPLVDHSDKAKGTTGADRTHLLALWVGAGAKKWNWAVERLVEGVESHARLRYGCTRPRRECVDHMADNLDALSRLAGFNPPTPTNPSTDTWSSNPGCTLRFAEVLAKIAASGFRIGELLYLFNATPPQDCEDPFPLQETDDALHHPFDLPEEQEDHALWRLRKELLEVEIPEEEACERTWHRFVAEFREKFGYAPPAGQDPLLSIGQHFFPCVLEASGYTVSARQRQYRTPLTSTTAWNSPPASPFQYDAGSGELWVQLPLADEAVAAKLSHLPELNSAEQAAVQDLYFAPRADLAFLAFLFPDWQKAELHLIQECDEARRWSYFLRHFALADARRRVIARHLAQHVAHRTSCHAEELASVAGLVLSRLFADENTGTPWESDSGVPPSVMWTPSPSGGAIPALLGLIGTGLLGEYGTAQPDGKGDTATVVWREVRGPMEAFGHERDHTNAPVPTVIPGLGLSIPANPLVTIHNGYAVRNADGLRLGGAEAFRVRWSGVLLIEEEGEYAFHAGAPTPECERPDFERAERSRWRVTLKRGTKTWEVLNHQWPGDTSHQRNEPRLRCGAYQIVVEYSQPAPDFAGPHIHPRHSGFQLKYAGPDSEGRLVTLPLRRLYRDFKDSTLDQGITFLPGSKNAQAFLRAFYTSTIRDIRRTYQRAFKAVLFCGKLGLSARPGDDECQSELGYMLGNPANFAGHAYYRTGGSSFTQHLADFDFNFLPLQDNYHAPAIVAPDRSSPSLQRTQAMFDWWERIFDYDLVRREVARACEGPVWHLFAEASANPPSDPARLLRHIGANPGYWNIDLRFCQDQNSAIYSVSAGDLEDDRWLVRAWHADRWVRRLQNRFHPKSLSEARPDLWAAPAPGAPMPASGVSETGNENLSALLANGCLENGEPRRYEDLRRLNDGLRERGRNALVSYLCALDRVALPWMSAPAFATVPGDLSDLLLLDVATGICERASRIDEAITAIQTFIRRSRLGLEPDWKVTCEFARLWDSRFETYRTWERCKRRELYRENWIEWRELEKARCIEAFRFLESELRTSTLSLAAPGGLDWWADDDESLEHAPKLLQRRIPSELQPLSSPQSATREGLGTLGSPEYSAQPTWLAAVPQAGSSAEITPAPPSGTTGPASGRPGNQRTPQALVRAAAAGGTEPQVLPLWMESAMKLGTRFVRVAAAGVPQAALRFAPHGDEPQNCCCHECGHDHPVLVDEYYFWLVNTQFYAYTDQTDAQSGADASFTGSYQFGFQDSYYDQYQQQSAEWNDEDRVPSLLAKWQPTPAVRLAWCRVHNGQFGQPRKSDGYVAISTPADLAFLGRAGDSLWFQVSGSATPLPPGYGADTSSPGFRYDLPADSAVALPQVLKPPAPPSPSPYPGGLLSYPFFAYHEPGAPLFPGSWFSPVLLVAESLRTHCNFEQALNWYRRGFDPLQSDCTWMKCNEDPARGTSGLTNATLPDSQRTNDGGNGQGACCDSSKVTEEVARNRALTLHYCETLVHWGDALMRRRHSPEAFQQARLIYDTVARITGRPPQTVLMREPANPQQVSSFTPAYPPLNPRLLDLYSVVADRRGLIHSCQDARRLRYSEPGCDMSYFGDNPLRDGWRTVPETCADESQWCCRPNPYRFLAQIERAVAIAGQVRELGSELLAAYEKGDGEYLASIRAGQEREMFALGLTIRQDQWRDADWQIQALQQTKDVSQTNLIYYTNLFNNDLINDESQNLNLATNAMQTRTGANITAAIAESFKMLPDSFVGAMSTFIQAPTGTKLAGLFETISRVMQTVADIQSATASIDLTEAGWQRRSVEWFHQMQTLPIEIRQIELQIHGAQMRRDQALQELNNQQRQTENAAEVEDFLRDKFTATDLYLWLQKETAGLHCRMYELALHAAREAERAFNFERGYTTRRFLPEEPWNSLHQGLLAGERLEFALRHMQKTYLNENVRERELTKHFSLRRHFPMEFLRLRTTGCCEIEIPEWMFDLDFPGHYMRRIKNLTLTIPCVTGPYTGVHCRLTLLGSTTRIHPRLNAPPHKCCCPPEPCGGDCCEDERLAREYETCPDDPRIVRHYSACEAIATSTGQNDSGLFELSFNDERYLPFEYMGAVSRWRIELPRENNYFDFDSLSDTIIRMNYTAREGGDMLRRAAHEAARRHLPGDGWCFFDVRHEFPDAWQLFRDSDKDNRCAQRISLRFHRRMFPFVPGTHEVWIDKMAILFDACGEKGCGCPETGECPCSKAGEPACHVVEFSMGNENRSHEHDGHEHHHHEHHDHENRGHEDRGHEDRGHEDRGHKDRDDERDCELRVPCLASDSCSDLYCGIFDTRLGPLGEKSHRHEAEFRFPSGTGEVEHVFLLCRYTLRPSAGDRHDRSGFSARAAASSSSSFR